MRLFIIIIFFSLLSFSELVETFTNGIEEYDFSAEHKKLAFVDSQNHFYYYDLEREEIISEFLIKPPYEYRNFDFESEKLLVVETVDCSYSFGWPIDARFKIYNKNAEELLEKEDTFKKGLQHITVLRYYLCNYRVFYVYNYDYSGPHGYFSESINLKVYESYFSDSIVVESLYEKGSSNFNNHVRPDVHFYQGEYFFKNYPLDLSLDGGNDFSNFDLFDGSKLGDGELIYKIYDNSSYFLFQNENLIYLEFLERVLELENITFSSDHDKIMSLKNGIIKSYILSSGVLINERNISINGSLDLYDDICVVISDNELHKFQVGNILSVSDDKNILRIHPNPADNIIYLSS